MTQTEQPVDRLSVLPKVIWPIVGAIVGMIFSYAKYRSDLADAAARIRISNAQLVSTFFPVLTGTVGSQRAIALRAIAYADSNLATELSSLLLADADSLVRAAALVTVLSAVGVDGPGVSDSAVRRGARQAALRPLVEQMFSPDKATRILATRALATAWRHDSALVPVVLSAAEKNASNADGIFNSITVLQLADPSARAAHSAQLDQFITAAKTVGPKVAVRADSLRQRPRGRAP
jgi:hypothetical protein